MIFKIALIDYTPAPYKDPVIEKFNCSNKNMRIDCFYIDNIKTVEHKEWKYNQRLKNTNAKNLESILKVPFLGNIHKEILSILKNHQVICVCGYYPLTNFIIILGSFILNKKIIYMTDGIDISKNYYFIKKIIYYILIKKVNGFWVPGRASKKFLMSLSAKSNNIISGLYCFDYSNISQLADITMSERSYERKKLDIEHDDFLLLFIGKLKKKRNIKKLIKVMNCINNNKIKLLIIGDGEESDIVKNSGNKNIRHISKVCFHDIHKYYKLANGYLHFGKEQYSLALEEAVFFELPIVASNRIGAAYDFVRDGINGYLLDNKSDEMYKEAILKVYNNEITQEGLYKMKTEVIKERNVQKNVELFNNLLNSVINNKR